MNGSACASWTLVLLLVGASAPAQERLEVVGPEPATLRLGDSARVDVRIVDPTGALRDLEVPRVEGLDVRVFGPSQQTQELISNGRRVRTAQVVYQLELQPKREGTFVLPPFPVWTGTKEQWTRELRLEAKKDLRGEELGWLAITPSSLRVYVHEPVRFHVDCGVQQGVRLVRGRASNGAAYSDLEVQAPWLEEFPGGERIELAEPSGNVALMVSGGNRLLQAQHDPAFARDGRTWLRFSFDRAFLPTRVGRVELSAPSLRFHVVRSEGRDVFGLPRGGMSENFYVYGQPLAIEVLPIPDAGRPSPYYGAVGRFTIDAALDRDQVRVGNSIKLTLTVRGQGNLEFLRLPELDVLPGLHKLGQAEAKRDADRVVVTYDLTPTSADVREVPAIDWNYFDTTPGVERFVTVQTRALPLQVQALAAGETLAPVAEGAAKAVMPGVDDVFDLPPLVGPPVVVVTRPGWLVLLLVAAPWLLVLLAVLVWRGSARRRSDVLGGRARGAAKACLAALQQGGDPLVALTTYLGDRLGVPAAAVIAADAAARLQAAGIDSEATAAVVAAIERGTAARYGGGAQLDADTVRALVQRLERQRFGVGRLLPLWLLPLSTAAAFAAPVHAQQDVVDAAIAAYRAGDHAAAEAAFARAYAATGDRRLQRARGNCFVRQTPADLPRALWAYESARLGLPRDEELLANLRLVRNRLELTASDAGFAAELGQLRQRLSAGEQLGLCTALMACAAVFLVCGWRRPGLRWLGCLAAIPACALAVELLWLGPARPPTAVALRRLELVAEPRGDLAVLATVRPGVLVDVLGGGGGSFVRVRAGDRIGFVPTAAIAVVE